MNAWRNPATKNKTLALLTEGKRIMVFDTETTGLKPEKERVIEFSCVFGTVRNGELVQTGSYDVYIKPPFLVSDKITELTGITNSFLDKKGVPEEEAYTTICKFFDDVDCVAGYNVSFDLRFVSAMAARYGVDLSYNELDVLEMARDIVPASETANYKLQTIASLLGLDGGISFHNALADATCTMRLLRYFWEEYKECPKDESTGIVPKIFSINRWSGYKGEARIYVNTNIGAIYFDVKTKTWHPKSGLKLETVDMVGFEHDALLKAGVPTIEEFAKIK